MKTAEIATKLAALAAGVMTTTDAVEFNDWAVNTVRDYCAARGYPAAILVAQEAVIIEAAGLDLDGYLAYRRIGCRFCLSRSVRGAVLAVVKTRRHFEARRAAGTFAY